MTLYGWCGWCGGLVAIRKGGTLRHHSRNRIRGGWDATCPGTGQVPQERSTS